MRKAHLLAFEIAGVAYRMIAREGVLKIVDEQWETIATPVFEHILSGILEEDIDSIDGILLGHSRDIVSTLQCPDLDYSEAQYLMSTVMPTRQAKELPNDCRILEQHIDC